MSKIPFQINPQVGIQLLDDAISAAAPATRFQFVQVAFNSTANVDTDIVHTLNSTNLGYLVVGLQFVVAPPTTPCIYQDVSGTARAWQKNYLILRSNVGGIVATLLLFVKRTT